MAPMKNAITVIVTLIIVAVIRTFFLRELNHYESSCMFMLMYLCMSKLLEERGYVKEEKEMEVEERKEENRQMNKLVRILTERLEQPEFLPGGVPVRVAAAVYGKAPYFIHEGIRAGWLPIGHCKPGEQKDSFYISPKRLWEDTGFIYTGQTVEEVEQCKKK